MSRVFNFRHMWTWAVDKVLEITLILSVIIAGASGLVFIVAPSAILLACAYWLWVQVLSK